MLVHFFALSFNINDKLIFLRNNTVSFYIVCLRANLLYTGLEGILKVSITTLVHGIGRSFVLVMQKRVVIKLIVFMY